LDNTYKGNF